MKYYFESPTRDDSFPETWETKADSLEKAIRRFRIGCLFPFKLVSKKKQICEPHMDEMGHTYEVPVDCKPGATIAVYTVKDRKRKKVGVIPAKEDTPENYSHLLLPPEAQNAMREVAPDTKDLMVSGGSAILNNLGSSPNQMLASKLLEIEALKGSLELQKRELNKQVAVLQAEVKQRLKAIWMIELYVGTQEEVICLASGTPAPEETPISVRQRVLCMDEELSVYDWTRNPERIGQFDYKDLEDFDKWLTSDPAHLQAILPESKGIIGLRPRRYNKDYGFSEGKENLSTLFMNAEMNEANAKTYILVRNGENLYRIWADISLWPYFFPKEESFDTKDGDSEDHIAEMRARMRAREKDRKQDARKTQYIAGMLVVQGLIDRSTLFQPLPEKTSIFNLEHQHMFHLIRDAENLLPERAFALTWRNYEEWLQEKIQVGTRVLYRGPQYAKHDDWGSLGHRTGVYSIGAWPSEDEAFTVEEVTKDHRYYFKYLPREEIWNKDSWESQLRKRRVSFRCYGDEMVALDFISWKVLSYFLNNRNERASYADSLPTLWHWAKLRVQEDSREEPFVMLVLSQAGLLPQDPSWEDEKDRVRRLIRWWKLKTKAGRSLSQDEPKALRMILKAFKNGQDWEEDPEMHLLTLRG